MIQIASVQDTARVYAKRMALLGGVFAETAERDGRKTDYNIATIQGRFALLPLASVTLFCEAGCGISTLWGGPAYNGHGFQPAARVRWWFAANFDVSARAVFTRMWFHQRGRPAGAELPFTDERTWLMLSIGFTPGL